MGREFLFSLIYVMFTSYFLYDYGRVSQKIPILKFILKQSITQSIREMNYTDCSSHATNKLRAAITKIKLKLFNIRLFKLFICINPIGSSCYGSNYTYFIQILNAIVT